MDITSPTLLKVKGALFLLLGLLAGALVLLIPDLSWQRVLLLGITIWAFCRAYLGLLPRLLLLLLCHAPLRRSYLPLCRTMEPGAASLEAKEKLTFIDPRLSQLVFNRILSAIFEFPRAQNQQRSGVTSNFFYTRKQEYLTQGSTSVAWLHVSRCPA